MTLATRRAIFGLCAVLAAGVLLTGYFCWRLCTDVDIASLSPPSTFDAKEAKRKLVALDSALKNGQHGYIRLTEGEINSHLAKRYEKLGNLPLGWEKPKPAPSGVLSLGRCQVDLLKDEVTVYTWLVFPFAGTQLKLVWTRTGKIRQTAKGWEFEPETMRVGDVDIPPKYQDLVRNYLGKTDEALSFEIELLSKIPAVELRSHELSKKSELRLYSYPETNVVSKSGN